MALPKLYDRIIWHNNTTPALNEDNLNAMSQALDDIDDRVIDLAGMIMEDVPANEMAKLDIDTFKSIVAASSDFADFKSKVAAL